MIIPDPSKTAALHSSFYGSHKKLYTSKGMIMTFFITSIETQTLYFFLTANIFIEIDYFGPLKTQHNTQP